MFEDRVGGSARLMTRDEEIVGELSSGMDQLQSAGAVRSKDIHSFGNPGRVERGHGKSRSDRSS
jgi:hypothetical protein